MTGVLTGSDEAPPASALPHRGGPGGPGPDRRSLCPTGRSRAHGAGPHEPAVPAQRLVQEVRGLLSVSTGQGAVDVVLEQRPVVRVRAPPDDQRGPAAGREPTEVGQPLLGHDDTNVVLGVV